MADHRERALSDLYASLNYREARDRCRRDGSWPLCPRCGEDELFTYSCKLADLTKAYRGACYSCGFTWENGTATEQAALRAALSKESK